MEQNGGSCAGERAAGEGGGRGSGATECGAHAGSQGSSPPGAPQAASPPLGEARAAARPAARGLSRLPDRGPPPSPPTRPHASREALEGQSGQLARTAAARGLRAALGEPPTPPTPSREGEDPRADSPEGPPPGHTAGPPRSTKKESLTSRTPLSRFFPVAFLLTPPNPRDPPFLPRPAHYPSPEASSAPTSHWHNREARAPRPPKWELRPWPASPRIPPATA